MGALSRRLPPCGLGIVAASVLKHFPVGSAADIIHHQCDVRLAPQGRHRSDYRNTSAKCRTPTVSTIKSSLSLRCHNSTRNQFVRGGEDCGVQKISPSLVTGRFLFRLWRLRLQWSSRPIVCSHAW